MNHGESMGPILRAGKELENHFKPKETTGESERRREKRDHIERSSGRSRFRRAFDRFRKR